MWNILLHSTGAWPCAPCHEGLAAVKAGHLPRKLLCQANRCAVCRAARRWTWTSLPLVAPPDATGAVNALLHYTFAPLFMQHLQPLGTAGQQGKWDGSSIWPGVHAVLGKLQSKHSNKGRIGVDFAAAQQLFLPRYQAWKATKAAHSGRSSSVHGAVGAVTLEQVLGTLDAVVVPLEGGGRT